MANKTSAKTAASGQQASQAARPARSRSVRPPASGVRLRAEQVLESAPPLPAEASPSLPPATTAEASPSLAAPSSAPTQTEEADRAKVRQLALPIRENIAVGQYEAALAQVKTLTPRQLRLLIETELASRNEHLADAVKSALRGGRRGYGFAKLIAVFHYLSAGDNVTDIAQGLISGKSNEEDITNQIIAIPEPSRKAIVAVYNAFYDNIGIGNDSNNQALYEHISAVFNKPIPIRRIYALFDHPVTAAERLYYASGSLSGADEHAALAILIGELSKGADALSALKADWKTFVQNQSGWLPRDSEPVGTLEATVQANLSRDASEILDLLTYQADRLSRLQHDAAQTQDPDKKAQLDDLGAQTSLVVIDKIGQILKPGLLSSLSAPDNSERKALAEQSRLAQGRAYEARAALADSPKRQQLIAETSTTISSLRASIGAPELRRDALRDLGSSRAESDEYELIGQQSESLADELYFLAAQKPSGFSAVAVQKISPIWQDDGKLGEFLKDTKTPVHSSLLGYILRPAYNPSVDLNLEEPYRQRFQVSIAAQFDSVARGASRIALELSPGDDRSLKQVYDLLLPLSETQRQAIVATFLQVTQGVPPTRPESVGEDFRQYYLERNFQAPQLDAHGTGAGGFLGSVGELAARHLFTSNFGRSEIATRLVNLLGGPATDLETASQQAKERDADTERPALRFLGSAVARTFLGGEGHEQSLTAARDRLAELQMLKETQPELFREKLAFYGVKTEAELVAKLLQDFDRRLATREGAREAAAAVVEKFITLVTRSALVVALGPTGLPGLFASLGSFVTGFLVHAGISGGGYDLFSRVNLATLLEEVAATVFEVAKIEDLISQTVKLAATPRNLLARGGDHPVKLEKFLKYLEGGPKILGEKDYPELFLETSPGVNTAVSILSGILKSQGTKVLEKGVGNAVAGVDLPTIHEFIGKYVIANLGVASIKTKLSPTAKLTIETDFLSRLPRSIAAVALHGPPPGAAFVRAVVSEAIKLLATTPADQLNFDKFAAALQEQLLWSAVFAVSVGTAQSIVGTLNGQKTIEDAQAAPDYTTQLLLQQVIIKNGVETTPFGNAYNRYNQDAKAQSLPVLGALQFFNDRSLLDEYYPDASKDRPTLLKTLENTSIAPKPEQ